MQISRVNKYLVSLGLCMAFCIVGAWGQSGLSSKSKKAIAFYVEAESLFVTNKPQEAIAKLNEAIKKDEGFMEAYLMKADILFAMQKHEQELEVLEQALQIDSLFFIPLFYNIGVAKYNTGQFDEVEGWMHRFKANYGSKRTRLKPDSWVNKAAFAQEAIANPVPFKPVNLGSEINSAYDEYWPSLSADGENLIFTVLVPRDTIQYAMGGLMKTPSNYREDFFQSSINNSEWQARAPVININTDSNEGAQALSADGNWMFFTACGRTDSKGSCDIYFSKRTQTGWTKPINVGSPVNTPFWESQPSFSSDGRTLFFISSRPGGVGKKDVWMASLIGFRRDESPVFGKAINLGEPINTTENENSPFIHADNQTLYFSSDGLLGLGKMDLYLSQLDSAGKWQTPVNLGYPINSVNDEIGLVLNATGDRAYFSSDGLGDQQGGKDIYEFEMPLNIRPNPAAYVKGRIYDKETREQLNANLRVKSLDDGKLAIASQSTDYSGEFLFCLPSGKAYGLSVEKEGYLFHSEHFDVLDKTSVTNPQELIVYLSKIKKGERIVLRNVFYETDSYALQEQSFAELDEVVRLLNKNAQLRLEIGGHTDNVGSSEYNAQLSKSRAQSVYDYLLAKGVSRDRLSYKGYGFSQPLGSNVTEEGKAKNRRTELKVL